MEISKADRKEIEAAVVELRANAAAWRADGETCGDDARLRAVYAQDADDLDTLAGWISDALAGKGYAYDAAVATANRLDTIVRDMIPAKLWRWLGGEVLA